MSGLSLLWRRPIVVFDLDGTLVDTLPDLCAALNDALDDLGLGGVPDSLVRESLHGGLDTSTAAALAHQGASADLFEPLLARFRQCYERAPARLSRPYPGVREVLDRLQQQDRALVVCSNKLRAQAEAVLLALELRECFQAVVGGDTCTHRKPHPDPLLHAIARAGGQPSQAVLVGDSELDVACAAAAGVDCLIFEGGYGGPAAAAGVPEACRFPRFASLLAATAA